MDMTIISNSVVLTYSILTLWCGFSEAAVSFSLQERSKSRVCSSGLLRDVDDISIKGIVKGWRGDLIINQITLSTPRQVIKTLCHINTPASPCHNDTDPGCACLLNYDPDGYIGYYVDVRKLATMDLNQAILHVQLGSNYSGNLTERTPYLYLPTIYDHPSVNITVDNGIFLPLAHCKHSFDFVGNHRFTFCTANLNNPLLTIHVGNRLDQTKSRPCLVSELPVLESTTAVISYVDECSRRREYFCDFTDGPTNLRENFGGRAVWLPWVGV